VKALVALAIVFLAAFPAYANSAPKVRYISLISFPSPPGNHCSDILSLSENVNGNVVDRESFITPAGQTLYITDVIFSASSGFSGGPLFIVHPNGGRFGVPLVVVPTQRSADIFFGSVPLTTPVVIPGGGGPNGVPMSNSGALRVGVPSSASLTVQVTGYITTP
jgi:hypothetical protein